QPQHAARANHGMARTSTCASDSRAHPAAGLNSFRVFCFQARLVFFDEGTQLVYGAEKAGPLLIIECDGTESESVHAHPAFFTHAKLQVLRSAGCQFLFKFSDPGFELLSSWFRHAVIVSGTERAKKPFRSYRLVE